MDYFVHLRHKEVVVCSVQLLLFDEESLTTRSETISSELNERKYQHNDRWTCSICAENSVSLP